MMSGERPPSDKLRWKIQMARIGEAIDWCKKGEGIQNKNEVKNQHATVPSTPKRPRMDHISSLASSTTFSSAAHTMVSRMSTTHSTICLNDNMNEGLCMESTSVQIADSDVVTSREPKGPGIKFSASVKDQLYKQWNNSLIIKLMGHPHAYNYFLLKLRQKWASIKRTLEPHKLRERLLCS